MASFHLGVPVFVLSHPDQTDTELGVSECAKPSPARKERDGSVGSTGTVQSSPVTAGCKESANMLRSTARHSANANANANASRAGHGGQVEETVSGYDAHRDVGPAAKGGRSLIVARIGVGVFGRDGNPIGKDRRERCWIQGVRAWILAHHSFSPQDPKYKRRRRNGSHESNNVVKVPQGQNAAPLSSVQLTVSAASQGGPETPSQSVAMDRVSFRSAPNINVRAGWDGMGMVAHRLGACFFFFWR